MPSAIHKRHNRQTRAVILAAGPGVRLGHDTVETPRCLLRIGKVTLVERQVRLLGLAGVTPDAIAVVAGDASTGWTPEAHRFLRELGLRVVVNSRPEERGSAGSLLLGLADLRGLGDVLVLDGDLVFEREVLDALLDAQATDVFAVKRAMSVSETRGRVRVENGIVVGAGQAVVLDHYPWYVYTGIARLGRETQAALVSRLEAVRAPCDVLDAIDPLLISHPVTAWTMGARRDPLAADGTELVGGSFADLERVTLVRKQALGEGREKLAREIAWLKALPEDVRPFFPQVLSHGSSRGRTWFEMPYYDAPSLRQLLMLGEFDAQAALVVLERVLDFMTRRLYSRDIGSGGSEWLAARHLDRANRRLFATAARSDHLRRLIQAETVVVDGVEYRNLSHWLEQIGRRGSLVSALAPDRLCMVHGDLHFQNILVDVGTIPPRFLLADPRGETAGSDPFYDLGKLWHSCHGLYDFIHTDQADVELTFRNGSAVATLRLGNPAALAEYRAVLAGLDDIVGRLPLASDPTWRMKVLFAEAMHFASVMPFHLRQDGLETRAVALYLTAVKLVSAFAETFEIAARFPTDRDFFNINTEEEYRLALAASREF